jgi:hypothetical protein
MDQHLAGKPHLKRLKREKAENGIGFEDLFHLDSETLIPGFEVPSTSSSELLYGMGFILIPFIVSRQTSEKLPVLRCDPPLTDRESVYQVSVNQASVDQVSVIQASVNQGSVDQASVNQTSVNQESVDQASVNQTSSRAPQKKRISIWEQDLDVYIDVPSKSEYYSLAKEEEEAQVRDLRVRNLVRDLLMLNIKEHEYSDFIDMVEGLREEKGRGMMIIVKEEAILEQFTRTLAQHKERNDLLSKYRLQKKKIQNLKSGSTIRNRELEDAARSVPYKEFRVKAERLRLALAKGELAYIEKSYRVLATARGLCASFEALPCVDEVLSKAADLAKNGRETQAIKLLDRSIDLRILNLGFQNTDSGKRSLRSEIKRLVYPKSNYEFSMAEKKRSNSFLAKVWQGTPYYVS